MTSMKKPGDDRAIQNKWDTIIPLHSTIEAVLSKALTERGVAAITIKSDGEIHRFDAPDKKHGNLCGWYIVHTHNIATFGFWNTGEKQTVTLSGEYDPAAAAQAKRNAQLERKKRDRQKLVQQAIAAERSRSLWERAHRPYSNPISHYLSRKGVGPHNLRQQGNKLIMPLFFENELVNIEWIFPDGKKRTLFGGRVHGAASLVGHIAGAKEVLLAEGWATAATLHEATGCPVVVARYADNLSYVARRLRQHLPHEVAITVCGDDDHHLPAKGLPNKGRLAARHAALLIGAKLIMPVFCNHCENCTDFNDVALCQRGIHGN
nr:toprim domain-containing protein [uncultured Halomonas sp.]